MTELRPKERIIGVWRRHLAVEAPWICLVILLLLIPALFSVPLLTTGGKFGRFVFLFLVLVPFMLALERLVRWWWSLTTITNQRILMRRQHGLLFRELQEIPYNNIGHVAVVAKGIWAHLWHYGSIHIKAIDGTELTIRDLAAAHLPAAEINNYVARAGNAGRETSSSQAKSVTME